MGRTNRKHWRGKNERQRPGINVKTKGAPVSHTTMLRLQAQRAHDATKNILAEGSIDAEAAKIVFEQFCIVRPTKDKKRTIAAAEAAREVIKQRLTPEEFQRALNEITRGILVAKEQLFISGATENGRPVEPLRNPPRFE